MSDLEKFIEEKFSELAEKVKSVKTVKDVGFSQEAAIEFCTGFDIPIIGILEFLKTKTIAYYANVDCQVLIDHNKSFNLAEHEDFNTLVAEIKDLAPPIVLDFKMLLSEGFYTFSKSIEEVISVWFQSEKYVVKYLFGANQELMFEKRYHTHLTVDEIIGIRDQMALNIVSKITAQFSKAF